MVQNETIHLEELTKMSNHNSIINSGLSRAHKVAFTCGVWY